jgi:hypothetical protein
MTDSRPTFRQMGSTARAAVAVLRFFGVIATTLSKKSWALCDGSVEPRILSNRHSELYGRAKQYQPDSNIMP